jgi:phosphatidylserine/phosphatidylglycerophosphate/cardiolipin synthase-like enzyme
MLDCFSSTGVLSSLRVDLITDLRPDSILTGALDVEALLAFANSVPHSTITYLPNLHAKVYIADQHTAIITSANLTDGGLIKNFEYGVVVNDPQTITQVRTDLSQYASLGNIVPRDALESLTSVAVDLKNLRQQAERSIQREFRRAFNQKLEVAKLKLLSIRAEGKTTHGIFADTILYLLARGALRTVELHPLIKQLHPDLCDDGEERIIKGVHFGKKWKHHVRNAQVYLRRRGSIYFDGTHWRRTD